MAIQAQKLKKLKAISEIGQVSNVNKIAYAQCGQLITVWTFVENPSPITLKAIYKLEQKIMHNFPDLSFDFSVIFGREQEAPAEFVQEFF